MIGGTITTDYNYLWSPVPGFGQGTDSIWAIGPGTYTITISDANGCLDVDTIKILDPPAIVVVVIADSVVSCSTDSSVVTATPLRSPCGQC